MVKMLLEAGAKTGIVAADGLTALGLAKKLKTSYFEYPGAPPRLISQIIEEHIATKKWGGPTRSGRYLCRNSQHGGDKSVAWWWCYDDAAGTSSCDHKQC